MTVTLKFLGALRHSAGRDKVLLDYKPGVSLIDILNLLTRQSQALRRSLLSEEVDQPKPNALILVNGREISVLKGLQTEIEDGDEVVFVPVVHGG